MKVIFDDMEFSVVKDDFRNENKNSILIDAHLFNNVRKQYFKDWMINSITQNRCEDYKRDGTFKSELGEGELLGCFPISVDCELVEVSFDMVNMKLF